MKNNSDTTPIRALLDEAIEKDKQRTRRILSGIAGDKLPILSSDSRTADLLEEILAILKRIEAQEPKAVTPVIKLVPRPIMTVKQERQNAKLNYLNRWFADHPDHIHTGYRTVRKMILSETGGKWDISHTYIASAVKPLRKKAA